ncbi:MAG: hypothetical protein CSA38_05020 [Flavobacteriales bacterium]|nr:MAG: hypothetical protein CSA38_05020 [Flavobacteriales bacterium]
MKKNLQKLVIVLGLIFGIVIHAQEEDSLNKIIDTPKAKIIMRNSLSAKEKPLYILDGKVITHKEFKEIDPKNIKGITVLKEDAKVLQTSCRSYKNTIIVITTKNK